MTSTLSANNAFENNCFSAHTFYGASANSKPFDQTFGSTAFSNNIWQSNSRDDLRTTKRPVARPGGNIGFDGMKKELSLTLPDVRSNAQSFVSSNDRNSPTTLDGKTMPSDSLSAHRRSNRDSTVRTPTSITSNSDLFVHQTIQVQDARAQRSATGKSNTYPAIASAWDAAKEFRPSSLKSNLDANKYFPSSAPRSNVPRPDSLWNALSHSAPLGNNCEQPPNQYHPGPVLSVTSAPCSDSRRAPSQRDGPLRGQIESQLIASFNGLRLDKRQTQQTDSQMEFQPVTTGNGGFQAPGIYDQDSSTPYHEDAWNQTIYAQQHSIQPLTSKNFRSTNHLQSTLPITGPESQQGALPTTDSFLYPGYNDSRHQDRAPRANQQFENYVQDMTIYRAEHYPQHSYEQDANSMVQYRTGHYAFDPALAVPYLMHDPALERPADCHQVLRSPLLEEFRINKAKKFELKDIYDHIVEFSGDQLGSRFIQQKLEVANSDEKDRVFTEIARDSRQLMTDVFGNYVIQKMFEHGNQSQKKLLAGHMKGHVYALSTQTYGCRVVQKALEHVLTDQQASLIRELDGFVLKVVENQNGNHVIQKAIERIPGEHIQFIIDAHRGQVHYLSKHSYGCRVIQRMLEHCQPRAKRQILDELHMNISDLIQDAFGNYVVQHVIVNGETQDRKPVIDKVQSRLLENAMHKFASNVVEKAMDYADEGQRQAILRKLTGRDEHGQSQVINLLGHQYGNYVIQKSAAHLSGHTLASLIDEMEQYLITLRRVSTGKQVAALESSIRDARQRLNSQRYEKSILNAPTHPRTSLARR